MHVVGGRKDELERLRTRCEQQAAELVALHNRYWVMWQTLASIHALLPPTDFPGSAKMPFIYYDPDPHRLLRYLAARIRTISTVLGANNAHHQTDPRR
jgi:hypothetical protein